MHCNGMTTMRSFANAELAVISRALTRLRSQSALMRVVGAKTTTITSEDGGGTGTGISILPHRFNPRVGLSQVRKCCGPALTTVIDGTFVVERKETLLDRLRGLQ